MYDVISIRQANPIEEVAARSGVELRLVGQRLVGSCPFHRDGRPSLAVYPHNDSYFCFGCGAGGDVIDFVGRLQGVAFKEAAAILAGESPHQATPKRAKIVRLTGRRRDEPLTGAEAEVVDAAACFYHDALWHSEQALAYIADRGINDNTARRCRLGFALGGLADQLRRWGLSLAAARRVGLLAEDRDTMPGRIIVPDLSVGRATWLTGRTLGPDGPRDLNLRLPTPLLGLGLVRGDEVVVTEGPFDWLTAVQWGLPTVALLGTHVSRSTERALARFRRVYLALDADEAGHRATAALMSALEPRAIAVELPSGVHDLNDLGRRDRRGSPVGAEAFQRCLEHANHRKETRWDTFDATAGRRVA
jgi:DNA primase